MTKHEADVIGGLNMTDQISNEAYKQIMIAAQDENEVVDVLNKIREEVRKQNIADFIAVQSVLEIIDKYKAESEEV